MSARAAVINRYSTPNRAPARRPGIHRSRAGASLRQAIRPPSRSNAISERKATMSMGLACAAMAFNEICCRLQMRHSSVITPTARGSRAPGLEAPARLEGVGVVARDRDREEVMPALCRSQKHLESG